MYAAVIPGAPIHKMNYGLPLSPDITMATATPIELVHRLPPDNVAYLVAAFETGVTFERMALLLTNHSRSRDMWLAYNIMVLRPCTVLAIDEAFLRGHGNTYRTARQDHIRTFRRIHEIVHSVTSRVVTQSWSGAALASTQSPIMVEHTRQ
jgi:hypothetical protein